MENVLSRNVADIPEASRKSLEGLLGRQLSGNQRVLIMVLDPASAPSAAQRAATSSGLRAIIAEAESHADRVGASEAEIDAAVDEAMVHVRRRPAS